MVEDTIPDVILAGHTPDVRRLLAKFVQITATLDRFLDACDALGVDDDSHLDGLHWVDVLNLGERVAATKAAARKLGFLVIAAPEPVRPRRGRPADSAVRLKRAAECSRWLKAGHTLTEYAEYANLDESQIRRDLRWANEQVDKQVASQRE